MHLRISGDDDTQRDQRNQAHTGKRFRGCVVGCMQVSLFTNILSYVSITIHYYSTTVRFISSYHIYHIYHNIYIYIIYIISCPMVCLMT